jgi:hypothetical protein
MALLSFGYGVDEDFIDLRENSMTYLARQEREEREAVQGLSEPCHLRCAAMPVDSDKATAQASSSFPKRETFPDGCDG